MKHYIIVKFNKDYNWKENVHDIKKLFEKSLDFDGVNSVIIHPSNSDRENRFHLMIEMDLTQEGLNIYDKSEMHQEWKSVYGKFIESKTIFDCE